MAPRLAPLDVPGGEATGLLLASPAPAELDALDAGAVIEPFKQSGALLLRGFVTDTERFRRFTERFGRDFLSYPGDRRDRVGDDDTLQTVDRLDRPIRLHSELSYLPLRPEVCWFYCVEPPRRDGQTLLCDGLRLAAELSAATRGVLDAQPLRYRADLPPPIWRPLFRVETPAELCAAIARRGLGDCFTLDGDVIHADVRLPALRPPRFHAARAFANNLLHGGNGARTLTFEDGSLPPPDALAELARVSEALTAEVSWQAGDVLMVDNTRMLHGRRRIEPGDPRRILTRFASAAFE